MLNNLEAVSEIFCQMGWSNFPVTHCLMNRKIHYLEETFNVAVLLLSLYGHPVVNYPFTEDDSFLGYSAT